MSRKLNRREFVKTAGTAAGFAAAAAPHAAFGQAPTMMTPGSSKPIVVSSSNGHRFKNGGDKTGVEIAYAKIVKGDDVLDALIAGVNIVELDPEETSVGYGGLPNADGIVQLDSCCMHGPKKRAGGVGALEGVRTPSLVAQAVMDQTDHHLIVGKGAQEFARGLGFKIEDDLNTERSRAAWLRWKRESDPLHYLDPIKRQEAMRRIELQMIAEGIIDPNHFYGTINCDGVNAKGDVCGVTTTSGLAWKIPGRLGDSPILGAGLYVDNEVGAAGSTGRGEANLYNLCSFLIVEEMRRGAHPKDAGMTALRRIKSNTIEKRLLNPRGEPNFNISFYVLSKKGEHAGVAMYGGQDMTYSYCDQNGPKTIPLEPLLQGQA
ncbi:MAG: N(4)-(beta-N-acetylglucosaminyl)-L-asparaginase [Acidobacteriota bacterium]|jgi:N4-(beta-N-acetylglucosaminyl)-L-asparaginase|nr:N(4)-(beta-N-acetylglucosaminyl)-L-asparaginase [Acidobacteriota bacterium]